MSEEGKNLAANVDHVDLMIAIARLEGKMDALNERIGEKHQRDARTLGDHEKRIRDVEKSGWKLQGLAGVVAAIISGGIAWLWRQGGQQ